MTSRSSAELLRPLPDEVFDDLADADPAGRPVRPGHGPATALLGAGPVHRPPGPGAARASEVVVFDGRIVIARHERADRQGRPVA